MELSPVEKALKTVKIDTEKIAEGFYNIIPDDAKSCMRLGMLPAKFMELLENTMKEKLSKIITPLKKFNQETFGGWAEDALKTENEFIDKWEKETRREAIRKISSELIHIATIKGLCIL